MTRREIDSETNTTLKELSKTIYDSQNNFAYYLIGLAVAAIGFSVNQTIDKPIDWFFTLVFAALILWLVSVYFGISYIRIAITLLRVNYREHESGKESDRYDLLNNLSARQMKKQILTFVLGLLFFIAWYIVSVIKNKNC